jgi:uncharacterized membrane protein
MAMEPAYRPAGGMQGWRGGALADVDEERLAKGLGWFSIGLGLAEVAAPHVVADLIGVRDDRQNCRTLQGLGLREIATGIGILSQDRPGGWLWARVAGDVMDLAVLGSALAQDDTRRGRTVAATAAVAGVTLLDAYCAQRLSSGPIDWVQARAQGLLGGPQEHRIRVRRAITIDRTAEELYRFWRQLDNLPRFMRHLDSVQVLDERRSHWKAKAPLGRTVEWDAEITEDRPNERLAWRSLEGADVPNDGWVAFERAPGGRGTTVRVELRYDPPGGIVGATLARLFGEEPGQQAQEDLRAFKQVMEVGEVVQSDATAKGGGPAQPSARPSGA